MSVPLSAVRAVEAVVECTGASLKAASEIAIREGGLDLQPKTLSTRVSYTRRFRAAAPDDALATAMPKILELVDSGLSVKDAALSVLGDPSKARTAKYVVGYAQMLRDEMTIARNGRLVDEHIEQVRHLVRAGKAVDEAVAQVHKDNNAKFPKELLLAKVHPLKLKEECCHEVANLVQNKNLKPLDAAEQVHKAKEVGNAFTPTALSVHYQQHARLFQADTPLGSALSELTEKRASHVVRIALAHGIKPAELAEHYREQCTENTAEELHAWFAVMVEHGTDKRDARRVFETDIGSFRGCEDGHAYYMKSPDENFLDTFYFFELYEYGRSAGSALFLIDPAKKLPNEMTRISKEHDVSFKDMAKAYLRLHPPTSLIELHAYAAFRQDRLDEVESPAGFRELFGAPDCTSLLQLCYTHLLTGGLPAGTNKANFHAAHGLFIVYDKTEDVFDTPVRDVIDFVLDGDDLDKAFDRYVKATDVFESVQKVGWKVLDAMGVTEATVWALHAYLTKKVGAPSDPAFAKTELGFEVDIGTFEEFTGCTVDDFISGTGDVLVCQLYRFFEVMFALPVSGTHQDLYEELVKNGAPPYAAKKRVEFMGGTVLNEIDQDECKAFGLLDNGQRVQSAAAEYSVFAVHLGESYNVVVDDSCDTTTMSSEEDVPDDLLGLSAFDEDGLVPVEGWPDHYWPTEHAPKTAAKLPDGKSVTPHRVLTNVGGFAVYKTVIYGAEIPQELVDLLWYELSDFFSYDATANVLTQGVSDAVTIAFPKVSSLENFLKTCSDDALTARVWERFWNFAVSMAAKGVVFSDHKITPNWGVCSIQGDICVFPFDVKMCKYDSSPANCLSLMRDALGETSPALDAYLASLPRPKRKAADAETKVRIEETRQKLARLRSEQDVKKAERERLQADAASKDRIIAEQKGVLAQAVRELEEDQRRHEAAVRAQETESSGRREIQKRMDMLALEIQESMAATEALTKKVNADIQARIAQAEAARAEAEELQKLLC